MAKRSPLLTAKRRNALASSSFAIPAQKAYPIDTLGRARDALSRVSANGTPDEQRQVANAVAKKYPSLKASPFVRAKRMAAKKS